MLCLCGAGGVGRSRSFSRGGLQRSGACLRLVEDSEGIMPSRRGVQGVAMGVANRLLVITQEEVAGPEIRLPGGRRGKKNAHYYMYNVRTHIEIVH